MDPDSATIIARGTSAPAALAAPKLAEVSMDTAPTVLDVGCSAPSATGARPFVALTAFGTRRRLLLLPSCKAGATITVDVVDNAVEGNNNFVLGFEWIRLPDLAMVRAFKVFKQSMLKRRSNV